MTRLHPFSVLDFMRRNAALIAGVSLFVLFWMLVYAFAVYRPSYAAKSTVIIKDSAITARFIEPEQYYAMQTTSSSSSNPVLNTMGILKSSAISDALWRYFLTQHPEQLAKNKIKTEADWEKFFQDGSSFIKAKNQPGTDLIAIQFTWSNPVIAKEALEVVVQAFQNASRDLNKADQISRTKFLIKQVQEIETQLADIRAQKSDYQSRMHTVSVQKEGSDLAGSRMELGNKLSQLEAQANGKENIVRRYQQMLSMSPEKAMKASALGQNGSLSKLQDELYRLEQAYSQMNSSLTDTNPKVLEVKAQIEQVRANIEAERARTLGRGTDGDAAGSVVADTTRGKMIADMLTAQGEANDLRAQAAITANRLGEIDGQIRNFPGVAEGLASLEQKEASLSNALDHLRQKVLEGRLKEEQTLSNVFIVDAPRLPDKAQFPTQVHLIVLGVVLGLATGLAVAFAKEQFLTGEAGALPAWMEPIEEDEADAETYGTRYQEPTRSGNFPIRIARLPQADSALESEQARTAQPAVSPSASNSTAAGMTQGTSTRRPAVAINHPNAIPLQPVAQAAAAQQQAVTATNTIQPEAVRQQILQTGKPLERKADVSVDQPLFDRLVPVAGPLAQQTPAAHATFRDDLIQPLVWTVNDEALMPPKSSRVRVMAPPAVSPERAAQSGRPSYGTNNLLNAGDIPSLHAAPQPSAPEQSAPAQDRPNHADRRVRSLPRFLLEGTDAQRPQSPVEVTQPRQPLLAADENLLEEVSPWEAPTSPERLQAQRDVQPAYLANPQREPLGVSSFWFRKPKANRTAETRLVQKGQNRYPDAPGSLSRRMQALDPSKSTHSIG